jgi:error-prone DNA polymerase
MQDARKHFVDVRAVDVTQSDWDCTLEGKMSQRDAVSLSQPAIRLALRLVKVIERRKFRRRTFGCRCQISFCLSVEDPAPGGSSLAHARSSMR